MPQFDVFIFFSSVAYLLFIFFSLMFFNQFLFLPKISAFLKLRSKLNKKNLEKKTVLNSNLEKLSKVL